MAFQLRNLSVLAYANGFTLWSYRAFKDTLRDVAAPGYFTSGHDSIKACDMILISAADGGTARMISQDDPKGDVTTLPLS